MSENWTSLKSEFQILHNGAWNLNKKYKLQTHFDQKCVRKLNFLKTEQLLSVCSSSDFGHWKYTKTYKTYLVILFIPSGPQSLMEQPLPMSMSHGPQMLHDGSHLDPEEDHYRGQGQIKDEFQPLLHHHLQQQLLHPPMQAQHEGDGSNLSTSGIGSNLSSTLKQEITDLSLNGKFINLSDQFHEQI